MRLVGSFIKGKNDIMVFVPIKGLGIIYLQRSEILFIIAWVSDLIID